VDLETDRSVDARQHAVCRNVAVERTTTQIRDEAVEAGGVERAEEPMIHLDTRRLVATRKALGIFDREHPVVSRLTDTDP
jgi:hypothetical protein